MSSVLTKILSSTVGLLWNKARDSTAAKLKDGDVTDAKIRQLVTRELDDIKTELRGLSRKDLLSSYSLFKQGVDFLNAALDKSMVDHRGETSKVSSEPWILNEALELSHAVGKLRVTTEFEFAKERFKNASFKATEAFCNEALSNEDRIFAGKLRIVSEMLGCLDSPETAIIGCLSFLQDLHSLPAVREMFSVYLGRGVLSKFNKAERVANVKSVMLINYVLFQFNFTFSRKLADRLTWPGTGIELADRSFNPILDWQEISERKSWGEKLIPPRNELILDKEINLYSTAVNSHGDVVVGEFWEDKIQITFKTGEVKVVRLPEPSEGKYLDQGISGLAVDNNNNVYVVKRLVMRNDPPRWVLNVLDNDYVHITHYCTLDFLGDPCLLDWLNVAVSKTIIIMIKHSDPQVYVCDKMGHLKRKFRRDSSRIPGLSITERNQIITPSDNHKAVHLFTEKGSLKSTMKLPENHLVRGAAFHYVIGKIIVLTYVKLKNSYFLLCYSEAGELQTSTLFIESSEECDWHISSHPSGPIAVVREKSIIFI